MKLTVLASAAALGLAMMAPAMSATITNGDGTKNWTGFDWDSNGTAYTTGFAPVANDDFSLTFFSWATSLKNNAANLILPHLDTNADGVSEGPNFYEYTVVATLNERVSSCSADLTTCTFNVLSGSFSIYYDLSPDANANAGGLGTGFADGVLLIAGTFGAQPGGTFTVSGTGGRGITVLQGAVSSTNLTYINPALSTTTVGTTLQLGDSQTNGYQSPGGFNGSPFSGSEIVFQADANQSFGVNAVPEPATLSVVGLALLAGGLASRKRSLSRKG